MSDQELSENVKRSWPALFSRIVGKGKDFTVKKISSISSVPESALYSIGDGTHQPRWDHAVRLLRVLPNSAVNELLRPIGLTVHAIEGERCDHSTLADLCRTAAEFAEALEDGRVDHQEYLKMRPFVEAVRDRCDGWLAEQNPVSKPVPHLGVINGDD